MLLGEGISIERGVKEGYHIKVVILPLLTRLAQKRLQIGTNVVLIITSTANNFSGNTRL